MKLTVKSNIKHNGALYEAGAELEVDEKSAALLIEAGAAEEWSEPKKGKKAEPEPEGEDSGVDGAAPVNPDSTDDLTPADKKSEADTEKEEPKPKAKTATKSKTERKSKRRG